MLNIYGQVANKMQLIFVHFIQILKCFDFKLNKTYILDFSHWEYGEKLCIWCVRYTEFY